MIERYLISIILFLILNKTIFADDFAKINTPTPGISLSIGTHQISLGFSFGFSIEIPHTQLTFKNRTRYYFKSLGSEKKGFESRFEGGLNFGWKERDTLETISTAQFWKYKNQIGYAYIYYIDEFETSQKSGIIKLKFGFFEYQMENDFFAFRGRDKFRTGAFYMGIQLKNNLLYVKNIGYTGDPYFKDVPRMNEGYFPSKYGYMDMSNAPLGDKSIGTLSIGWSHYLKANQQFSIEAGIDAEEVRNYFQNRLIHDSKYVGNPHIPMLDIFGKPYLYDLNQQIRPRKLYVQAFFNDFFLY